MQKFRVLQYSTLDQFQKVQTKALAMHSPLARLVSMSRVRTMLALGYWVLPNIFQYWVVLGIGQYFYWLSYPIPILLGHRDTSFQQMTAGKLGRR